MDIQLLVQLYKETRFLWDSKDDRYFNKKARDDAWEEISQQMDIPVSALKEKMTSLMGSYRREKSRENKSSKYKSKWFAYKWFDFLKGKCNPGPALKIAESADTEKEQELANSPAEENQEQPVPKRRKIVKTIKINARKKVIKSKPQMPIVQELTNAVNRIDDLQRKVKRDEDEYELYGRLLAKKLRHLPRIDSQELMHEIDGLVLRRIQNNYSESMISQSTPDPLCPPVEIIVKKRPESPSSTYSSPRSSPIFEDFDIS